MSRKLRDRTEKMLEEQLLEKLWESSLLAKPGQRTKHGLVLPDALSTGPKASPDEPVEAHGDGGGGKRTRCQIPNDFMRN